MHETGIVRQIIAQLTTLADQHPNARLRSVHVRLGALSQMSAEHFREHYYLDAGDGPAAKAELLITVSDDIHHADALHVVLEDVELELPS